MIPSLYLHSSGKGPKLRIGLLLDSYTLARWQARILEDIRRCDFAEIALVALNAQRKSPSPRRPLPARLWRLLRDRPARRLLLFSLYEKWDQRVYGGDPGADPFSPVDCESWLAAVPALRVQPVVQGFTHRFRVEDVQAIRDQDLDVALRFGFNILRGEILSCARYGVWSYHHGDNDYYRGGPPGFWELVEGNPVTGVLLQVLNEDLDAGLVLTKAHVATARGISQFLNQAQQYEAGLPFVIQKLHELHQHGGEFVRRRSVQNRFAGRRKIYRGPSNAEMLRFLIPGAARKAWRRSVRRRDLQPFWNIAVRRGGTPVDPAAASSGFEGAGWLQPPRGHFWADPFLVQRDGGTWVFFEDYRYGEGRGVIACAPLQASAEAGPAQTALELPYHASYPFLFCEAGEVFLIPETGQNRTIELFRAERFPDVWRQEKVLFQGLNALDTTLWVQDGLYWFFVTVPTGDDSGYQLLLFSAESLTGEWKHHPASPLCLDVRRARSAGSVFVHDGKLIRPAQDCSVNYGRAIRFHEIYRLNPSEYEERLLGGVEPTWAAGVEGTHTYNRAGDFEVLDGVWYRPPAEIS
jgi:hypothetical protein